MIKDAMKACQDRIESVLDEHLPNEDQLGSRLHEAMRYSVLDGGKRVRPLLVYATGNALGVSKSILDIPAAAIEMLHAYSLIHDDLPAMDDDDLRRGKPTNHIVYDEATAILAGDALQTQAFHLLATSPALDISPEARLRLIEELSYAAGSVGMVEGQAIDLASVDKKLTLKQLEIMHRSKTGALIRASVIMPAVCSSATEQQITDLSRFADCIGLAFQVQDDILDIESDTETLGKQQGADIDANKPTFPSIIGLEASKDKLMALYEEAIESLESFGNSVQSLRELAEFIVKRVK